MLGGFELDITLRNIPSQGFPAFPNESLSDSISEYTFDFFTLNGNYSLKLERPPSSNHKKWLPSESRPIVHDIKNSTFSLCSFPNVVNDFIRISCDVSLFEFNDYTIRSQLKSIHKEENRTFFDCL
ncbi:hypothetical protein P3G55_20400 [Leptospira sp. 96542]|nr:hypothetical protein [Leptospira sp. 96542]